MSIILRKPFYEILMSCLENLGHVNTTVCSACNNIYGSQGAAYQEFVGITWRVKCAPGLASLTFSAVTGSGLCCGLSS